MRKIVQSSNTLSIFEFNGGKTRNVTLCKSQGKLLQLAYLANFCISFKPETNSVGCSKHCAWNAFVFKKPGLLFKNFEYSTRPYNGICDNNILQHYHEIHPILLKENSYKISIAFSNRQDISCKICFLTPCLFFIFL